MVIVLYLIDNSASMNQRSYLGITYLDIAKNAVDAFAKFRGRDPSSRSDRYMLVTYGDSSEALKSGWKESHSHFLLELKNLQAYGLTTFGCSLREALSLLNAHRLHTGIDTYGQGRNPFFLEPTVIISLTDGHRFTNQERMEKELYIPPGDTEKGMLTREPFRWDQRLFSVILKLPGIGGASKECLPGEMSIKSMCEATGGKCYSVTSQKSLIKSLEAIAQKMHPGVVVCFRKIGFTPPEEGSRSRPESPTVFEMEVGSKDPTKTEAEPTPTGLSTTEGEDSWKFTRKMIYVKTNPKTNIPTGHWPIPEAYWCDLNLKKLPPRTSHPVIWFNDSDVPPLLIESFPFDKYELEPSPLTRHILSKKPSNTCWQVFISDSGKEEGLSHSFGYLKASSSGQSVNLFIMPFNYSRVIPLIEDLIHNRLKPPPNWRHEFAEYISDLPTYYAQPLRNAMRLLGASTSLVPDFFDGQVNPEITSFLKKMRKQAKVESEKLMSVIAKGKTENHNHKLAKTQLNFGPDISVAVGSPGLPVVSNASWKTNPFEIKRGSILSHLKKVKQFLALERPLVNRITDDTAQFEVPISQMGNYQEHLKRINPLREVDTGAVRTQLFGNPYRLEKNDTKRENEEADEHMVNLGTRRRSKLRSHSQRRSRSLSPVPLSARQSPANASPAHQPVEKAKSVATEDMDITNNQIVFNHTLPALEGADSHSNESTGRTSPESFQSDAEDEKSSSSGLDNDEMENLTDDQGTSKEGISTDSKGPLRLLKHADRKRSPSPNDQPPPKRPSLSSEHSLVSQPAKLQRQSSTDLSSILHGPLTRMGKPETTPASKVLSEEFAKQQNQERAKIRLAILQEIRKSKDTSSVLQHVNNLKGSVDERKAFVMDIMKEARRWKKKALIEQLQDWMEKTSTKVASVDARKGISNSKTTLKKDKQLGKMSNARSVTTNKS